MENIDAEELVRIQKEIKARKDAEQKAADAAAQPPANPYPLKGAMRDYPLKGKV